MGTKICIMVLAMGLASTVFGFSNTEGTASASGTPSKAEKQLIELNDQAWLLRANAPDSAMTLAIQAERMAKKTKSLSGEAKALRIQGIIYKNLGDYPEALSKYIASIQVLNQTKDSLEIARVNNNIGTIHALTGNLDKAETYFKDALDVFERNGSSIEIGKGFLLLANTQKDMGSFDQALEGYAKAIKVLRDEKAHGLLAMVITNSAGIYGKQKNYRKAEEFYLEAIQIQEENGLKAGLLHNYNGLGVIYHNSDQYTRAIPLYEKALGLAQKQKDLLTEKVIVDNLANVHAKLEQYEKAFDYKDRARELQAQILDEERTQTIAELSQKYESEQQKARIAQLELNNRMQDHEIERKQLQSQQLWITIGFLFVISLLIYGYTRRNLKAHQELIGKQQEVLRLNGLLEDVQEERAGLAEQVEKFLRKEPNFAPLKNAFLTHTEEMVFLAIANNKSVNEIAQEEGMDSNVVSDCRKNIFAKMQIRSSEELRDLARRLNIIKS